MKNLDKELKNGLILISFGIILFLFLQNIWIGIEILKGIITIFSPFLLGLIIAFILNVPMNMMEKRLEKNKKLKIKKKKIRRGVSLIVSVVSVLLILLFVIALIIPDLGKTITSFLNQIPDFIRNIEEYIQSISQKYPSLATWANKIDLNPDDIKIQLENWMKTASSGLLTSSLNIVFTFISKMANFIIALIFAFYVLAEKEKLAHQFKIVLKAFIKEKYVKEIFRITELANKTFSKFISGQCLEACILGLLCFIGMILFRFPYALSISVLVALTALIPIFGAFIAMIVGTLLISVISFKSAIWFVIFFLLLQQIEGNIIYPKVVGNSVGLPAIWTMMAVTVGGSCFGIFGMLISVPLSSILYALLKEYIQKKNSFAKLKEI